MIDRATEYAKSVVNGEVVAGKLHILACKRHLKDLERQGTKEFPYIWKPEESNRIIDYAETLTIIEGKEPKPVELFGFQDFDLGVPFGWVKMNTGFRRFRRSYESMARQNGKTFKNGIRGTYIASFSGYNYGKLFTAATKKRQAKLAWSEMQKFIIADEDLSEYFRIQEYKNLITALNTGCEIEALSKESGLDDGFRSIFNSIDEIHQHKDNSIYKALYNGTRSLDETFNSMITTRGKSLNSFCYDIDKHCQEILNNITTAEDFFVDIYCLNTDDDPFDEKNWIKSNPLLARTEKGMEILRTDAKTARDMGGSELSDFLTKSLNMWARETNNQYIDVEKWAACGTDKTLAQKAGQSCYVGLDLSSGGDLTSFSLDFPPTESEKEYIYSHSFMPRGRFEEHIKTDLAPYEIWEKAELLTVTGGECDYKNDYKFIIKKLNKIIENYDIKILGIAYDPHNADTFLDDLEQFGVPLLMVNQSARFLNDATDDLRLQIKSEQIEYDKQNELLSHSFFNAKIVKNSFGEIKVDKEPNAKYKRIDPVDSSIDAHTMLMKNTDQKVVNVENEVEDYLEQMGWS